MRSGANGHVPKARVYSDDNNRIMKIPTQSETDWVLGGARSAPYKVLNETGDWTPFLPEYELQRKRGVESNGCTNFGSLNIFEILQNFLYNRDVNYSERFTAVMSGQTEGGNDPHKVLQSVCDNGVIDERLLPFTPGMTFKEYLSPKPMTAELRQKGLDFAYTHIVRHEYIYDVDALLSADKKRRLLGEALKRSPVGVSVYAWSEGDGKYIKPEGAQDNHWCVLVKIDENGNPIVFDSYEPELKKLTWDHFTVAKGVYFEYVPEKKTLMASIMSLIITAMNLLIKEKRSMRNQLYESALKYIGIDASPADRVPDEVACAESVCDIIKSIMPTMPVITGTWTLWDYMEKHAKFKKVTVPMPGTIIISPTGKGNGSIRGHVGICGDRGVIMSNTSFDNPKTPENEKGKWMPNFTIDTWIEWYKNKGGMPIYMYDLIG